MPIQKIITEKLKTMPSNYERKDFMTTFEYKSMLIDLVNDLDDIHG